VNRFTTLLVLVLAFLAASFPARNSDLWFHLATGRLLAQGEFRFGADPFAYTTEGVYWPCHTWLFDWALYELYELAGGPALVVLKALLIAGLAGLLLRVRRPDGPGWLPIACVTLAVVAMSPRLLLQPACVSYFFLGLTLWLLQKGEERGLNDESGRSWFRVPRSYLVLLLVFALWVNLDDWFLLGPALVALFWLGDRLAGQRRTPGWLVPAGLAACLLNPYTFHAFSLPPELSAVPASSGLWQDVRFQALFTSPWSAAYLQAAAQNPTVLAYFVLTAAGVVSFLMHRPALRSWRLVVWLPFAALAAWQARTIPFFAVVAAPITALNGQDYLAGRRLPAATTRGAALEALAGRLLLDLALLALIALTWPGWLAGPGREGRHVAWEVQAEPSLQQAAETLHRWRRQGLLSPGERVFGVTPDMAQYGAWSCPQEKHFLDHRYQLFPGAAREFEVVCRALLPGLVPDCPPGSETEGESPQEWQQILRKYGVGIVVIYDRAPQRLFAVLRRLADDPRHWTLLHMAGQALVVGWNEARPPGGFGPLAFDADRLAYGPQEGGAGQALPAALDRGPEHLPPPPDFWARFLHPPAAPTWESAAATTYLHYFGDSEVRQREQQFRPTMGGYAASLAGLPALPPAIPQAVFQLVSSRYLLHLSRTETSFLVRDQLGPFFAGLADRPPALLLLTIRAARRAVAANPADANAWLRLGQAYLLLRDATWERSGEGRLPPLAQLRHVQIATALEQAVRLDPDLEAAHRELAFLYGERNYLDQSLEHRRDEVRLSRRAGPRPGETAEVYADRMELLEQDTAKLVELVQDRRQRYADRFRTLQGDRLAQARLALSLGLARQAVEEILLPCPADLLGAPGIKLELELLLTLGRVEEVRAILGDATLRASKHGLLYYQLPPPQSPAGGPLYALPYHWPAYEWLHILQAAAVGDYAQARAEAHVIRAVLRAGHERLRKQQAEADRRVWTYLPGLLSGPPPFLPALAAQGLGAFLEARAALQAGEPTLRAHQADLDVLEGLLALEQGDPEGARAAFAEARQLCTEAPAVPFAGGPIAAGYLSKLNIRK
jgi:hypothetical protein